MGRGRVGRGRTRRSRLATEAELVEHDWAVLFDVAAEPVEVRSGEGDGRVVDRGVPRTGERRSEGSHLGDDLAPLYAVGSLPLPGAAGAAGGRTMRQGDARKAIKRLGVVGSLVALVTMAVGDLQQRLAAISAASSRSSRRRGVCDSAVMVVVASNGNAGDRERGKLAVDQEEARSSCLLVFGPPS